MASPTPTRTVRLGDGRVMAVDDVGDPGGTPVLYLHGTPDSRLARHPDDGLATAAGVRLLAIDRPGYGGSSATAGLWSADWPVAVAADVARVLDELGVDRCAVLAWSGGALTGLALAGAATTTSAGAGASATGTADAGIAGDAGTSPRAKAAPLARRVAALGIVAGLVPRQAYDDTAVRAAGENRLGVVELADAMPPGELGDEVAPLLAPFPCDVALAAEHQAEHRSAADAAELATVPGGAERMAAALVEAVRPGPAGVAADVEAQARPLTVDLGAVSCPVHLLYGTDDRVAPPAFGHWYESALPRSSLTVIDGAGHYVAFTAWADMLATLAAAAVTPGPT